MLDGFALRPGYLDRAGQEAVLSALREVIAAAPPFRPRMPRTGTPFSVAMTNCGPLGWVADIDGYRYQPTHPETGAPWPAIPPALLDLWNVMASGAPPPEACLVNIYAAGARMGLHQDRDEQDFGAPIVSLSLGDTGMFRLGGVSRKDPTRSLRLASGDAMSLGGPARLAFHGIDRVIAGSSTLLAEGGRINCTLRRVNPTA